MNKRRRNRRYPVWNISNNAVGEMQDPRRKWWSIREFEDFNAFFYYIVIVPLFKSLIYSDRVRLNPA